MRKLRRGIGLGTVMLLVFILSTLAFSLAGTSITHLQLSAQQGTSTQALNLARSAVAQGIERVMADPTLGTDANPGGLLDVAASEGTGYLAFDKPTAGTHQIAASTNNLAGTSSTTSADGQMVPSQSLRLVGVGTYRGTTRQVVAIVHVPEFPYGLASEGPINDLGGLTVAGVPVGVDPKTILADPALTSALPSDLHSNASADSAVTLAAGSVVSGSARTVGGIQLATGAQVRGEMKPHAQAVPLPTLNLDNYDPGQMGGRPFTTITSPQPDSTFSGLTRCAGPRLDLNGSLTMQGGLLYVAGDLHISGGLQGTGIVAATGNITIDAGADFNASNKVALIAGNDLTLHGRGKQSSNFQGLVYTAGALDTQQITVTGVLLAHPSDPSKGVTLSECNLVQCDLGPVAVSLPPGGGKQPQTVTLTAQRDGHNLWSLMGTHNDSTGEVSSQLGNDYGNHHAFVDIPEPGDPSSATIQVTLKPDGTFTISELKLGYSGGLFGVPTLGGGPAPGPDSATLATTRKLDDAASMVAQQLNNVPKFSYKMEKGTLADLTADLNGYFVRSLLQNQDDNQVAIPAGNLAVDPSKLLKLEDRLQVRLWREN